MRRQAAGHRGQHCRLKLARLGVVRVKPVGPVVVGDHHGHAVVDLADIVGCLSRDNRGRPQPGAFVVIGQGLIAPELVEPGEGQRLTVLRIDVVGLLALFSVLGDGLPFVVAVGGNDAAALGEGAPERGLDRDGLGPGVDELAAARGVLGPERDQAPAHHAQLAGLRLLWLLVLLVFLVVFLVARTWLHDRVHPPGGRHVVVGTGLRVGSVGDAVPLDAELLEELKALTRRHEATAHADLPFIALNRIRHVPLSLDWPFITIIPLRQTCGAVTVPGACSRAGGRASNDSLRVCMPTTRTVPGPRPPRPLRSAPGSGCPRPSPSPTGPWSWPPCPTGRPGSRTRCGPWGPRSRTTPADPRRDPCPGPHPAGGSPPGSRPRGRGSASTRVTP